MPSSLRHRDTITESPEPLSNWESSSFLLTTPPPTPRMWACQGSAIHSPHQTQYWTCHSWGSTGTHGWRTVRASAVCPHLSLKLPSDICNCLLDNVNTCTICFATSMDKCAHINWEPKKKTEKNPLCTLRETRTKQVNTQNPGLLSSSSSKINETLSLSRKLLTS